MRPTERVVCNHRRSNNNVVRSGCQWRLMWLTDMNMPGVSSNAMMNGAARISFTQLKTQVHGDLEVLGDITASNIVSLTAPAGSGVTISGHEAKVNHDNANIIGFNGWASDTNRFDAYYT